MLIPFISGANEDNLRYLLRAGNHGDIREAMEEQGFNLVGIDVEHMHNKRSTEHNGRQLTEGYYNKCFLPRDVNQSDLYKHVSFAMKENIIQYWAGVEIWARAEAWASFMLRESDRQGSINTPYDPDRSRYSEDVYGRPMVGTRRPS